MATITLYADKINQMPFLLEDSKKSVSDYQTELFSIKSKMMTVNKSVCNLDDAISSVQTCTQVQVQKASSLEAFKQNVENFISDVVVIDNGVADIINQNKTQFYEEYCYLKPKTDLWEKFCNEFTNFGDWCKEYWKEIVASIGIIVLLTITTIVTGGAAGGVAGFILSGALKGAILGGISGAFIGMATEVLFYKMQTGSWDGVGKAAFRGAIEGLLSGIVMGGIAGGAGNAIKIFRASYLWNQGTFKSGYASMKYHYNKHVLQEGFSKGNNIVKYTQDAAAFADRNSHLLKYTYNYRHHNAVWKFAYDAGQGGAYDSTGNIIYFWYQSL